MLNTHAAVAADMWARPVPEPGCRLCGAKLRRTLIDLGEVPLANRTVAIDAANDNTYRLHARICDSCSLVQIADVAAPETIVAPAPYRVGHSAAALTQARRYAETMLKRLRLGTSSLVIEVGSNDGFLLRQFQAAAIPTLEIPALEILALGIDAAPTAAAATDTGISSAVAFFNTETAMAIAVRRGRADLVIANNVLSHVPDLFDFVAGLASLLRPNGVLTLRVPHLLSLLQNLHFDCFRHDAYSYLSLRVLEHVLRSVGLRVFDAERLPELGGSLRVHACHGVAPHADRPGLKAVRQAEKVAELDRHDLFSGFSDRVAMARQEILDFLHTRRAGGHRVAAYGVATRGSTMLNCCQITTQEITCVADPDAAKHGRLLPGSRIPIVSPEHLLADPPDDVIILRWPNAQEIATELAPLRLKGTQLWTAVPRIARV